MTNVPTRDRAALGRRLLSQVAGMEQCIDSFHQWLQTAINEMRDSGLVPVVEGKRIVALGTAFGHVQVVNEYRRQEMDLLGLVIFYRPPTPLVQVPRLLCAIELEKDGSAFFSRNREDDDLFQWDHGLDGWAYRNARRLAGEIAIAWSGQDPLVFRSS